MKLHMNYWLSPVENNVIVFGSVLVRYIDKKFRSDLKRVSFEKRF